MDIRAIQKSLTQFRNAITEDIHVDELIIFGSYLEGTATDQSDVDVIVVSRDFQKMDSDQRLDLLYHRSIHIRPEIHPWGFTPEEIQAASELTTWGYARKAGIRFV